MDLFVHLLARQHRLMKSAGRTPLQVTADEIERGPHGESLQRQDHFGTRLALHAVKNFEIALQQRLFTNITGRGYFREVNHVQIFFLVL